VGHIANNPNDDTYEHIQPAGWLTPYLRVALSLDVKGSAVVCWRQVLA